MKPGLSLRVSQHLSLTPQLQQSIRLLQLSTLELASEVEQMLDDNPFLERADDSAPREEFGLQRAGVIALDIDHCRRAGDQVVQPRMGGCKWMARSGRMRSAGCRCTSAQLAMCFRRPACLPT